MQQCVCGSGKSFESCCNRFLSGQQRAKTPEQLMRSRYSAFALGGYGQYLLETWFPPTAKGLTAAELSQLTHRWQKLEVISKSQQGDEGTVEFKAYHLPVNLPSDDSLSDDDGGEEDNSPPLDVMHEVSEFKRIVGQWFYVGGRVT